MTDRVLIAGGRVLSPGGPHGTAHEILIEDGRIAALFEPGFRLESARIIEAKRRLIIPGLVNAHTHGHGALAKGTGDRWSLPLLLNAAPWIAGARTLEEKRLSVLLNAAEMLKKGVTACYDLFSDFPAPSAETFAAAAEAYEGAGMRAVLAPMIADQTFFQSVPGLVEALPEALRARAAGARMQDGGATLEAVRAAARAWRSPGGLVRLGIAPTIPIHCTDDFLRGCHRVAQEFALPMQMHVAEARYQVLAGRTRYGASLVAHLDALGLLSPRFAVAHGVWLTEAELHLLAARGCQVAHNPGSNMRLGVGVAPARRMLRAGLAVGLGTDGSSSSDNQNMFEAMRLASFSSRLFEDASEEDWLSAAEVFSMATEGSARVLDRQGQIGRIAPGYLADMTLLDLDHVNWLPLNDALNQLVNTEDGCSVRDVFVGGRQVVRDGRLTTIDEARLARAAQEAAERLRHATAESRWLADALAPHVACFCSGIAVPRGMPRRLIAGAVAGD